MMEIKKLHPGQIKSFLAGETVMLTNQIAIQMCKCAEHVDTLKTISRRGVPIR